MVTVFPVPAPLAIVTVPALGVRDTLIDEMLTIVPVPLLRSGLAAGKLVSFAIGTNPPTSSTRLIIRASIAPVVATFVSLPVHATPDDIVSVLS